MENAGLTRGGFYRHFREQGRTICRRCPPVPLHRCAKALAN
jgi:hypothetical protein